MPQPPPKVHLSVMYITVRGEVYLSLCMCVCERERETEPITEGKMELLLCGVFVCVYSIKCKQC